MVSIIVPVYNAEPYLRRCVDSILLQSYSKFEVILVDDGSTDESGKICDYYAQSDSRITVVHKQNGGISSARNAGLKLIRGDYIAFVDSDDWVERDFIESLLSMMSSNVEIASCCMFLDYADNSKKESYGKDCVMSSLDVIETGLINQNCFGNYFCNKIFARKLFDGIQFPEGMVYEDVALFYKVLLNAESIALIDRCLYHYSQSNSGAISKNRSMIFRYNYVKAQKCRWCDLRNRNLKIDLSAIASSAISSIVFLCSSEDFKCNWMYDDAVCFIEELRQFAMHISVKQKILIFSCIHFPLIFNKLVGFSRSVLHR